MKFTILQETLQTGLRAVQPAVGNRAILPVLRNVQLAATETDQLILSATNLEIRLDHRMGAKIDEPGATTVPGRLLLDFVNSLPAEAIVFELDTKTSKLQVSCDNNAAGIDCIPAGEFPTAPQFNDDTRFTTLQGDVLGTMLKRALTAASKDRDSRPVLASLLVHFEGPHLTIAGADGFRLSVCSERFDAETWEPTSVLVPAWAFSGFKGLKGSDVQIFIKDRSQAAFRLADTDLTMQLIEGRFPDYNQIIPLTHDARTTVNTADLLRVVKTARIFARFQADILVLEIRDDSLKVSSTGGEMGDINAEIPAKVEAVGSKDTWLDIAFNARFLLEALSVMGSEEVIINTTTSNSPALLQPAGEADKRFRHVLIPMSLKNLPGS